MLKKLLKEQLYVVPGWSSDQYRPSVQRPTYQEDEYKATFPTPANTLPIRAELLDMMRQKITNTDLREQFEAMVKEHDATSHRAAIPTGQKSASGSGGSACPIRASAGSRGGAQEQRRVDCLWGPL